MRPLLEARFSAGAKSSRTNFFASLTGCSGWRIGSANLRRRRKYRECLLKLRAKPRRKLGRHPTRRLASRDEENPRRIREQRGSFLRACKLASKRESDQMRWRNRRDGGGVDARQIAAGKRIARMR